MKADNQVVKAFKNVGTSEIPEEGSSAREIILSVLTEYPSQWFTQKDFVTNLKEVTNIGHSNPFINGILRKLAKAEQITVEKRGRRVYYRAK